MTDVHVISAPDFADLAAGRGSRAVVAQLREGQLSKNLLALRSLLDAYPIDDRALALLGDAHDAAPAEVARVLTYPMVGAWAADSLRVLRGSAASPFPPEVMTGHLAGIAASAAIAAGLDFSVAVPARNTTLLLPGVGRAVVRGSVGLVSSVGGNLEIDGVPVEKLGAVGEWLPVLRMTETCDGLTIDVALDDVDWYRDCSDMGALPRLSIEQVAYWRRTLREAWRLLVTDHRDYAVPIGVGLSAIVPLRGDLINRGVTATSMDAFGAMSSSTPADPVTLAVGLVHEFQHGKLGALMDLVPLHTGSEQERFYAPWRDDPRPLGGLLHGAYAFVGVTDFWRVRRHHEETLTGYAQFEFARWRERVSRVIEVLQRSGRLTAEGEALVRGMRDTVRSWWHEDVPTEIAELARQAADDHRVAWRIRNLECDRDAVDRLLAAWRTGGVPMQLPPSRTLTSERVFRRPARLHLTALRLTDPAALAALEVGSPELRESAPDAIPADLDFAHGDLVAATDGYLASITADPGNDAHWAGLALCRSLTSPRSPATATLLQQPEWVVAVYRAAGGEADPIAIATWLAPTITDWAARSRSTHGHGS